MAYDVGQWPTPDHQTVDGNVIEADGICKAYARIPVLFPLTFSVRGGEGLALLGPNGSGKTTLLRLLAGATAPTAGSLRLCGYDLPRDRRLAHRCCAFVGHDSYLYDDLTGLENLRFFCAMAELRADDVSLAETLVLVGLRPQNRDRVRAYSAGMRRRLALARVLLTKPSLLLLDEPHASLDADGQSLVDAIVRAALASGRSAVIASHDRDRTLELCGTALVLESGRVGFLGDSAELRGRGPVWVVGGNA